MYEHLLRRITTTTFDDLGGLQFGHHVLYCSIFMKFPHDTSCNPIKKHFSLSDLTSKSFFAAGTIQKLKWVPYFIFLEKW